MDMSTSLTKVFGTGFMLAMLLAAFASFAQDEIVDDDELLPAVDTSAPEESETAPEPDVTRTTTGNRVMDTMELSRTEIRATRNCQRCCTSCPGRSRTPAI